MLMKNYRSLLVGLLLLQGLLIAVFLLSNKHNDRQNTQVKLLSFSTDKIDQMVIKAENEKLLLKREQGQWQLENGLPVTASKMEQSLEMLAKLKGTWPVATTASSHKRFNLEDDKNLREIGLFQQGKIIATLLIGDSPGFRKSYVRNKESSDVYALEINEYDFPSNKNDWLDITLLAVENLRRIEGQGFTLAKESTWLLEKNSEARVDPEKANALASHFEKFMVIGEASPPKEDEESARTEIRVENAASVRYDYTFIQAGESYYAKRSDIDHFFNITKNTYENISEVKLADLVMPEVESESEPEAE